MKYFSDSKVSKLGPALLMILVVIGITTIEYSEFKIQQNLLYIEASSLQKTNDKLKKGLEIIRFDLENILADTSLKGGLDTVFIKKYVHQKIYKNHPYFIKDSALYTFVIDYSNNVAFAYPDSLEDREGEVNSPEIKKDFEKLILRLEKHPNEGGVPLRYDQYSYDKDSKEYKSLARIFWGDYLILNHNSNSVKDSLVMLLGFFDGVAKEQREWATLHERLDLYRFIGYVIGIIIFILLFIFRNKLQKTNRELEGWKYKTNKSKILEVLENCGNGIAVFSPAGDYIFSNQIIRKWNNIQNGDGLSFSEMSGKSIEEANAIFQKVLDGHTYTYINDSENPYRKIRTTLSTNKSKSVVLAIDTDVTDWELTAKLVGHDTRKLLQMSAIRNEYEIQKLQALLTSYVSWMQQSFTVTESEKMIGDHNLFNICSEVKLEFKNNEQSDAPIQIEKLISYEPKRTKKIILEFEIDNSLEDISVNVNLNRIQAILRNLVFNSIQACFEQKESGFRLKMRFSLNKIWSSPHNDMVQLLIKDNGPGISFVKTKEEALQLFALNQRGNTRERAHLGLFLCKKLIKYHGQNYDILFDYKNNTGATFSINLEKSIKK